MKPPETFTEIHDTYRKLSDRHLGQLRDRFDKLERLKAQIDIELGVLADDINNYGTPPTQRRRSRFEPAQCGTESGYQAHRRGTNGATCEDCRAAHREHERIASARRKLRKMAGAA